MSYSYPAAAPTLAGDVLTVNRFLNNPTLVARRVAELSRQRFIGDVLLTGRSDVEGGAVQFETDDTLYSDRPVERVSPGGVYPLATVGTGTASIAKTEKWGQDTLVTDEKIKRERMQAAERAMGILANSVVKQFDSVCLSLIASAVTQTIAASSAWSGATPTILRDIMRAKATIAALNKGYNPNVLVVDDMTWAYLGSDAALMNAMARESQNNTVYTGEFSVVAGLLILPTPNLPATGAWMVDTNLLGGIGNEDLGGGYGRWAGSPIETKSMREDKEDQFRLRARRVAVPYVNNPGAAIRITGI